MSDPSFPPPVPPVPPVPQAPPPGAYRVPVGGYRMPVGGYAAPSPVRPSRATGALALVAALIATLVAPGLAGVFSLLIGLAVPVEELLSVDGDLVIAALSPVRVETLWAEIIFWLGTALGLFAIVGGIIAVARRRGRGLGIAAIVIAAIGPGIFFVSVSVLYGIGDVISSAPAA